MMTWQEEDRGLEDDSDVGDDAEDSSREDQDSDDDFEPVPKRAKRPR